MIEKLVQFLVGVVNTQLFERINGEVFETKYIKNAQKSGRVLARVRTGIDVVHKPRKGSRVQRLSHGMSVFDCLHKTYRTVLQSMRLIILFDKQNSKKKNLICSINKTKMFPILFTIHK